MSDHHQRKTAGHPEELSRLFLERANAGDVEGLGALYEADAVLALPDGRPARGAQDIREAYSQRLADRPTFTAGDQHPALINGDVALTSTRLIAGGATAEVARRQADGLAVGCRSPQRRRVAPPCPPGPYIWFVRGNGHVALAWSLGGATAYLNGGLVLTPPVG